MAVKEHPMDYLYKKPTIGKDVFIAPNSVLLGDITLKDYSSVWFGVVMRADKAPIIVGRYTNVQDNTTVHVGDDGPVVIGNHVVIGHNSVVHGCTIGNNCIIGMGSVILNNAKIGDNCIIGAGSLVTQNTEIPPGSLAVGSPARVIKEVTEEQKKFITFNAEEYFKASRKYYELLKDSNEQK
jgi:carbonic anhydrase/acetyltransferase-like protein (isoleucine patch superfamily)